MRLTGILKKLDLVSARLPSHVEPAATIQQSTGLDPAASNLFLLGDSPNRVSHVSMSQSPSPADEKSCQDPVNMLYALPSFCSPLPLFIHNTI